MKLKVFTTSRQIRHFLQQQSDGVIDKVVSIGEFFAKAIVVPNKRFIDDDLKKVFLYEALHSIDAKKLGLPQDFVKFFKNADFVLDFFAELAKEGVSIEELQLEDTYAEYQEHLTLLSELMNIYRQKLQEYGFVDERLIENYKINESFFAQFSHIEMEVTGYLTRFERTVLQNIEIPVELRFWVSRFNRPLIEKMFAQEFADGFYRYDFHKGEILEHYPYKRDFNVEVASFSDRIFQVHYVLASIEEFVERGCKPENIAVVLPDERFSEYLELFNNGNLNFAMGRSFVHSNIYQILEAIYKSQEDLIAQQKAQIYLEEFAKSDLLDFIRAHASPKELAVIDEELYRLSNILPHIQPERQLHFVLDRFSNLSFDDVEGGKITVMGLLEARGMEFDGVIVVDFNEGVVPNVGESDLFLNTLVRKRAGLPTRSEKEALQKHYYDRLISSARYARICYIESEEQMPSRFLYELGIKEGERSDEIYNELLFTYSSDPTPQDFSNRPLKKPHKLTPSRLQTLLECPLRYYFEYELQLTNEEEDEEFIFGSHFHRAVEQVLREGKPKSVQEYYQKIKQRLLEKRTVEERFEILSKYDEAIWWFCQRDFERLDEVLDVEGWASGRELEGYILTAKYDRLDTKYVIDYKTGSQKEGDRLQALFYAFLFDQEPLFYYLKEKKIMKLEDFKIENPKLELQELLKNLELVTQYAKEEKICKWCDYRFLCQHRVSERI